jgi:hypothetical protein
LIPGYFLGLRDRIEHRRPLIERHHAKIAIRIRQPRKAARFSDRFHEPFL